MATTLNELETVGDELSELDDEQAARARALGCRRGLPRPARGPRAASPGLQRAAYAHSHGANATPCLILLPLVRVPRIARIASMKDRQPVG